MFGTISTIKGEKSAAKFHYIKTLSGKVVAQSIAFRVVSICCQGVAPFPWYLNAKGPNPIGSTWRRAVLSADAGLLVLFIYSSCLSYSVTTQFTVAVGQHWFHLLIQFCLSLLYFKLTYVERNKRTRNIFQPSLVYSSVVCRLNCGETGTETIILVLMLLVVKAHRNVLLCQQLCIMLLSL